VANKRLFKEYIPNMCLAVPMKVISKEGDTGSAEMGGIKRNVSFMMLPDVKIGEYIIVHAGFAIERLDEKEAKERLRLLKEISEYDRHT
jgi:hydrogenase expression/formation protein HypC